MALHEPACDWQQTQLVADMAVDPFSLTQLVTLWTKPTTKVNTLDPTSIEHLNTY